MSTVNSVLKVTSNDVFNSSHFLVFHDRQFHRLELCARRPASTVFVKIDLTAAIPEGVLL